MRLIPASSAVWIMSTHSPWSVLPIVPNIIEPSAYSLTDMPVPPRILRFIADRLLGPGCHEARKAPPPAEVRVLLLPGVQQDPLRGYPPRSAGDTVMP